MLFVIFGIHPTKEDRHVLLSFNRKEVIFHSDNTCLCSAQLSKYLLEELSWEKLLT